MQKINQQKKNQDWEQMANLRGASVPSRNLDDIIILNLNDLLKSAKQLQQDSSAKHVSPTRKQPSKQQSPKKKKPVVEDDALTITKLKNPNSSRI